MNVSASRCVRERHRDRYLLPSCPFDVFFYLAHTFTYLSCSTVNVSVRLQRPVRSLPPHPSSPFLDFFKWMLMESRVQTENEVVVKGKQCFLGLSGFCGDPQGVRRESFSIQDLNLRGWLHSNSRCLQLPTQGEKVSQ